MSPETAEFCVVGAGYAGLIAARDLARAGKDVCVLEARDRVGGRIWTVERGGHRIDIGGAWLGGESQECVHALAREYDVLTHPTNDDGEHVLDLNGDVRRFRGLIPRVSPIALGSIGLGMARLDTMARKVPLDAPWEARRARAWDASSAGAWVARNIPPGVGRGMLEAAVRGLMTCDPSEVSLLHFLYLVRSANGIQKLLGVKGGYQQDLVIGGAMTMAERIAEELGDRVHCNEPVRAISQSDSGVVVTSDEMEVMCTRVVVATPPALAARIAFTPTLPPDRAQLLDRMPAGSIVKYIVVYPDAFWRRAGLSGQTIGVGSLIESTFDAGEPSGTPGVMAAFAFGTAGREMLTRSPEARRQYVLDVLVHRCGSAAAEPTEFVEQDWAAEPWSRGCFMAHLAPGVLTQYGRVVRAPAGRVHWAGTETATQSHGAIDGAIRSGMRVASEVIAAE